MSYVLAVDVGTSFTAAALVRINQNAQPVPESLPLGLRGTAVPSVVYYPEEGPILVGEAAERRGLDSPARVVREFKRRVGDAVPIVVGTLSLPAEDVFATVARWVVDRAEEREGAPPSDIILSHPASWGGHRTALIRKALATKGLHKVTLISEPEAAALHYASQVRVEDGSVIAVYDLGGGTFDTAVLRKAGSNSFKLLGRPEGIEGLGGADFDAAVFRHVAEHTGEALTGLDLAAPGVLSALARLRRECVEVKEALSSDTEASISVFLPGVQKQVRLVRSEFEAMIEEPVRETVDALECSLQDLGLDAGDLTAVLLIGGSSRIPFVAQLISEQFDRPIAVDADPKSSICLGAAVAALRALPAAEVEVGASVALEPHRSLELHKSLEPHSASQRASWSRKSGSTLGPLSVSGAVAGTGVMVGSAARFAGARAGAHAPRPVVRVTAVAAVAALFTVLTATAAESPGGLGSLTAMFVPPKAGAADTGSVLPDAGGGAAGGAAAGAAAAGVAVGTQTPLRGVEATAEKTSDQPASAAGIEKAASPTSGHSPETAAAVGTSWGGASSDSTSEGTGAAPSDPTQAGGSSAESPTGTPTINPDPTDAATNPPEPDPVTEPMAEPPAPVPDPTTEPPAPEPDPTTEPPAPEPDPTIEPLMEPVPDPTTEPALPAPDPTTEPAWPAPDPTTEPPAPEPPPADPAPTTDPPAPTEPAA
jgi:molecular chaperone DnaK